MHHRCENKGCVNPDHLAVVTAAENTHASHTPARANARKTHCSKGHPFSGENLYVVPKSGERQCRTCKRQSDRDNYVRRRRQNPFREEAAKRRDSASDRRGRGG
jgi:hypothetical protein